MQAAGGKVEIVRSRIEQGELIAISAGTLGLNAQGRIEGELQYPGQIRVTVIRETRATGVAK